MAQAMVTERLNDVRLVGATWWQGCRELLLRDNCFCKAISQAFIFHLKKFKCYSILHFAVCQLLCCAFLFSCPVPTSWTAFLWPGLNNLVCFNLVEVYIHWKDNNVRTCSCRLKLETFGLDALKHLWNSLLHILNSRFLNTSSLETNNFLSLPWPTRFLVVILICRSLVWCRPLRWEQLISCLSCVIL